MKNGKAVGPDNIPAEVGKCLYRKSWSEVLDRYLQQDLGSDLTNGKEASWFLYLRRKGTSWSAETTGQSSPCDTASRSMRECLNTACERRWTSVSSLDSYHGGEINNGSNIRTRARLNRRRLPSVPDTFAVGSIALENQDKPMAIVCRTPQTLIVAVGASVDLWSDQKEWDKKEGKYCFVDGYIGMRSCLSGSARWHYIS